MKSPKLPLISALAIDPDPAHDLAGKHRAVPIETLNVMNGRSKPWHSQILHLTITNAVAK